jgi:hypothetical protein
LALRAIGPECEAESVRFHGRRVTKVARKSNTAAAGGLGLNKGCETGMSFRFGVPFAAGEAGGKVENA